jgi:hypothetical protein
MDKNKIHEKIKKLFDENKGRQNYEIRVTADKKTNDFAVFCIQKNNLSFEEYTGKEKTIYSMSVDPYILNEFVDYWNDEADAEDKISIEHDEFVNIYMENVISEEIENIISDYFEQKNNEEDGE